MVSTTHLWELSSSRITSQTTSALATLLTQVLSVFKQALMLITYTNEQLIFDTFTGRAVAEKRRAFEEWLQKRDRVTYDRYRAQRVAVKLAVQAAKRMADGRWRERLGNDFDGNKNMFWKEVKRVRKSEQAREEMVKDVNNSNIP